MLKQYFTTGRGVTSTSATMIANFAQEKKRAIMNQFRQISFINEERDIVGSNSDFKQTKVGIPIEKIPAFCDMADKAAQYDKLCAWLREAVKAKEAMLEEVRSKDFQSKLEAPIRPLISEVFSKAGLDYPENKTFTEEDVLAEFSIKELAEYYAVNAASAVYGNLIHADAPLNIERANYYEAIAAPYTVDNNLVIKRTPSIPEQVLENTFDGFQALQRKNNSKYNSYKARIKQRLHELQVTSDNEYRLKRDAITKEREALKSRLMSEYETASQAYYDALKQEQLDFNELQRQEEQRIADLKIVIPDDLQAVFTELNSLVTA